MTYKKYERSTVQNCLTAVVVKTAVLQPTDQSNLTFACRSTDQIRLPQQNSCGSSIAMWHMLQSLAWGHMYETVDQSLEHEFINQCCLLLDQPVPHQAKDLAVAVVDWHLQFRTDYCFCKYETKKYSLSYSLIIFVILDKYKLVFTAVNRSRIGN